MVHIRHPLMLALYEFQLFLLGPFDEDRCIFLSLADYFLFVVFILFYC